MNWWPFSNDATTKSDSFSFSENQYTGVCVPPPDTPEHLKKSPNITTTEFKGFSAPPRDDFTCLDSQSSYGQKEPLRNVLTSGFHSTRALACWETVKTGFHMGAIIGGIFGGLSGCYGMIQYRNFALLPLSLMSGGLSFGFFLGCGMLVRCCGKHSPHE